MNKIQLYLRLKCRFYKMDHKIVFYKSLEHSEMQKNWYLMLTLKITKRNNIKSRPLPSTKVVLN